MAERASIAYMVRNGRGTGIVIITGTQTEFGAMFSMMQNVDERRTPLQHTQHRRAGKEALHTLLYDNWCYLSRWCLPAPTMARSACYWSVIGRCQKACQS